MTPVTPRFASTLALITGSGDQVRVFVQTRPATMSFATAMTVFPGGAVDPDDAATAEYLVGPPSAYWAGTFGCTVAQATDFLAAGIRETFEEVGVLFAAPVNHPERWVPAEQVAAARAEYSPEQSFSAFLAANQWVLRTDTLTPWARWVTPKREPRRYDTAFFVAHPPPGQYPHAVPGVTEISHAESRAPQDILDQAAAGHRALMPPTVAVLEDLAAGGSVAELLATERVITTICPP